MRTDRCRWCHRQINRAELPEPYWYHPGNESVYCRVPSLGEPTANRAEPYPMPTGTLDERLKAHAAWRPDR